MFAANKNRARLSLECLEGRDLADAKVLGTLAAPLGPVAVVQAPAPARQVSLAAPVAKSLAASSAYQYTAVTIKNTTNITLNYSFRWGNGSWKNFALAAGQSRVHYISALNQVATIAYDKSFAPGVQEQRYSLAGRNITRPFGFYLVEPTPTTGEGRLYTFGRVTNGVQLYS